MILLTIELKHAWLRQDVLVVELSLDDAVVKDLVGVEAVEGVKSSDAESGAFNVA